MLRSIVSLSLLIFLPLAGCEKKSEKQSLEESWSDARAKSQFSLFLDAYIAGSAEKAVALLCERDFENRASALAFIERSQREGSPFRVVSFNIESIKASWRGEIPLFLANVKFRGDKRSPGKAIEIEQQFTLRTDLGCIEGLGNQNPSTAPSAPNQDKTPESDAENPTLLPEAPVGANDKVIDL